MFNEKIYEKSRLIILKYLSNNFPKYTEDDVSEIIYKIISNYETYSEEIGAFSTWVTTIARNYMIDKSRKKSHIYSVELDDRILNDYADYDEINLQYDRDVMFSIVSNSGVNEDIVDMLQMKCNGYKYKEIGERFNITSTTVSNKINYVLKKIKKISVK